MHNGQRSAQIVRFGLFEADLETGELRKNGAKVPLQGQPFQVCAILLSHAGELVSREELRQQVWPEDTFVDFDHALNTAITKIRLALGDQADNPRFVETLPRRGYRFIAPVDKPSLQIVQPATAKGHDPKLTAISLWMSASLLLVLLSAIGIWRFARTRAEAALPPLEVVPMAAMPGFESDPAFSPDGNQVAFAFGAKGDRCGIYTVMVDGDKPLRLTNGPGDAFPTWSPDGRRVAFYRFSEHGNAIYTVPALGGMEQRLHTGFFGPWAFGLDWSPDGKVLALSESQEDKNRAWITLLSLADSAIHPLTSPSNQEYDSAPAFSPDGSKVVFIRGIVAGVVSDLYVVSATGGTPKQLTFDKTWIFGSPTWTPDGREIVFSSARGGLGALWRVSASGGAPRPVEGVGVIAWAPSLAPKGNRLVYQHMAFKDSVFRLNLTDNNHPQGAPTILRSEKGINWRPQFSPDGKRFAFESNGLGYPEIWACDSDGSHCAPLTALRGTAGAPRWSPDGRYIAFEFRPNEHSEIYLLEVGGGPPRLLPTLPGSDNGGPNWSRDGKWIYFYSDRGGEPFQLWKVPINGGPPVQITKNGGVFAAESSDGRSLYYAKLQVPGIYKMPLQGGEEERVLDRAGGGDWASWALARNGIYFRDAKESKDHDYIGLLNFFDFASKKITTVSTLDQPGGVGIGLSADGRSILYDGKGEAESSIMLVKNFR
ncbi:MAG TPA: winged helix-turn-helix domain-containing protein [Terriglobales bacterium]|nr:winged helix-turn-helix domain-containing protein [Terriglobales bacterium]